MNRTSIEWTDFTANPLRYRTADGRVVWACEKVSPGCKNCYASALSERYTDRRAGDWNASTMATLTPFLDEKELRAMLTYKPASGKRCFIGDMTDVFGSWVPDELLDELFHVMRVRADVTWQVLTKRADRLHRYISAGGRPRAIAIDDAGMRLLCRDIGSSFICLDQGGRVDSHEWPLPNVWLGVSCEDQQRADERIPLLLQTPAAVRFISAEPLLGPVNLGRYGWLTGCDACCNGDRCPGPPECRRFNRSSCPVCKGTARGRNLDWVIVGGESGHGARPCDVSWIRSIVRQCRAAELPCFVKQLGGNIRDRNDAGFDADSHTWADGPDEGQPVNPSAWPDRIEEEDRVEHSPNNWREEYQGAPIRVHLSNRKGGDIAEWPLDLRVREFPRTAVPA